MSRFNNFGNDTPPTRLIRNKKPEQSDGSEAEAAAIDRPTRKLDFEPGSQMGGANIPGSPQAPAGRQAAKGKTVLFRPNEEDPAASSASIAPTVAWLVIVDGPGRGMSMNISYGLNKIGRDSGQEIVLDYGDQKISRLNHASIEFDPKLRQFYLSKGENLVYLNGSRVGSGSEQTIVTGDKIELGETQLRFVAFCGPEFDWH